MVKFCQHPLQNIRFKERRKKPNGWHYEMGILKLNYSSSITRMILSLSSEQTLKTPIIGENNVVDATNFDLGIPTQGRNSCRQGLVLEEMRGWGWGGSTLVSSVSWRIQNPHSLNLVPFGLISLKMLQTAQPSPQAPPAGPGSVDCPWQGLSTRCPASPHSGQAAPGSGLGAGTLW